MIVEMPVYSERVLQPVRFKPMGKDLGYLRKQFSLSEEDCQDIFPESFIILHKQNNEGKLKELTSSLSTYFISICRNKAFEMVRANSRTVNVDQEQSISLMTGEIKEEKINAILNLFDSEDGFEEQKNNLVEQIVSELPAPCNDLLWGFYRDELSMKTLAHMYGYSEGSVKVTKHRCMEKFRKTYAKMVNSLFD